MRIAAFRLGHQGAGGGGLVLPGRGEDTDGLVVAGQTVDTRLDENHAELGVLVLTVALKVLADGDGLGGGVSKARIGRGEAPRCPDNEPAQSSYLLDKHVQVLRDIGGEACHTSLCQPGDQTEA